MSTQDETMRIVAEVVDKFSRPLRDLRQELRNTSNARGDPRLQQSFAGVRRTVEDLRTSIRTGLVPSLTAVGVTGLTVAGTIAAITNAVRGFSQSTTALSYLRRETGLTIGYMSQLDALAGRVGSSQGAMRAGLSAFARNMQELRAGVGQTANTLYEQGNENLKRFVDSLRSVRGNEDALKRVLEYVDHITDSWGHHEGPDAQLNRQKFLEAFGLPSELARVTGAERQKILDEISKNLGKISREAEEGARRFQDAIANISETLVGLRNELGNSGALNVVRDIIGDVRDLLHDNQGEFGAGLKKFFTEIRPTAEALRDTLKEIQSIIEFFRSAGDWMNWATRYGKEPLFDLPKFLREPFPYSPGSKQREEIEKRAPIGIVPPKGIYLQPDAQERAKQGLKEGASEGIQDGLRKMMLEMPRGTGGAQVIQASYGGGARGEIAATTRSFRDPMGSLGTRGDRNNNPGNIKYGEFARKHGATGQDERGFAVFPSQEAGKSAMGALLQEKYSGMSLSQIGNRWANNPPAHYLRGLEASTGLRGDQVPDLADPSMRARVMQGIMRGEGTGGVAGAIRDLRDGGGAVPSDILAQARKVAMTGGPGAVQAFMASQGYPRNGAWCGEFTASVVRSVGGTPPKGAAVASNWRNWGAAVDVPRPGDIAVRRGARTGATGSHVTIVDSVDPATGHFRGVGGNQGRWFSNFNTRQYEFRRAMPSDEARAADRERLNNRQRLMNGPGMSQKVEGDATVRIDLNGFPAGTRTSHDANGMFKNVELNHARVMPMASDTE